MFVRLRLVALFVRLGKDFVTKSTLLKHNKIIIVRVLKNVEIKEMENAYIKVRIVGLSMKKQNS